MNQWQQSFAKRVEALRESGVKKFEIFADEALEDVYEDYAAFTAQHDFRNLKPQHQRGSRFYKFSLSEDAYALLYFRSRGIDSVEFECECSAPGRGCLDGQKAVVPLAEANRGWIEQCFQNGLDQLIGQLAQPAAKAAEPVGV